MTRGQAGTPSEWVAVPRNRAPRFRLKPTAHHSGYVDGAWWPHSDDLMVELPGLLAGLSVRLGAITRVSYNKTEWKAPPAELLCCGRVVQLDGGGSRRPNTVEVIDSEGDKNALLVVPSHIDPEWAHGIVMAAAAPDDASGVDTLLTISTKERESRTKQDAARESWDARRPLAVSPLDPRAGLPAIFPTAFAP